jgi:hypothetical protein
MDMIAEIRRRRLVSRESISSIARDLKLSRPTVRKHCRTKSEPIYRRDKQPTPMLGAFQETLETWLRTERLLPKAQRRTARRLFEGLQAKGYRGAYDSVQRFVQRWKATKSGPSLTQAFVPLAFAPGEACQFDWSHEHVELAGHADDQGRAFPADIQPPDVSSWPTPERPRRWYSTRITVPSPSSAACPSAWCMTISRRL